MSLRFNIFKLLAFIETARPIKAKFHVESQWVGRTKVCSNSLVYMTNMAVMTIYGKNFKASSSREPKGRCHLETLCATSGT